MESRRRRETKSDHRAWARNMDIHFYKLLDKFRDFDLF
jgi:hypothetical protein